MQAICTTASSRFDWGSVYDMTLAPCHHRVVICPALHAVEPLGVNRQPDLAMIVG
jgi:hypothetical protein